MFWTIFLAVSLVVLSALLVMRAIDNYSRSRRRWAYCECEAEHHNRLMNRYDLKMAALHAEFYRDREKQAKSWWGMRQFEEG